MLSEIFFALSFVQPCELYDIDPAITNSFIPISQISLVVTVVVLSLNGFLYLRPSACKVWFLVFQYIGCLEVNTSMKSLDFDTRFQVAK